MKIPSVPKGCPLPDYDKDGVPDKYDKCPKLQGTENGCPKKEIKLRSKFVPSREILTIKVALWDFHDWNWVALQSSILTQESLLNLIPLQESRP